MPVLLPVQSITVVRAGGRVDVPVGKPFEFTAEEAKALAGTDAVRELPEFAVVQPATTPAPAKRGRGRPRKNPQPAADPDGGL